MENMDDKLYKDSNGDKENKVSVKNGVLLYLHDIVCLLSGIVLVLLLLFRVVIVSGPSMMDTLIDGDYLLLLSNVFYSDPKQGDIIVATKSDFRNGEPIIKRVIATEGQTVDIDFEEGIVYVDGAALNESYIRTPTNLDEGVSFPLTVDEGCIFVMGDNRNKSQDSRSTEIGLIDIRQVLGKAILLVFPGDNGGYAIRDFSRIGAIS